MTMKRKEFVIWCAFLIISLASAVYLVFFDHSFDDYQSIGAIPFVFFVCTVVFANVYTALSKNIGVLCLHSVMFVRLVVSPVLMTLSGYDSIFRGISTADVNYAVTLMCYECVLVYLVLSYMTTRSKHKTFDQEYTLKIQKPNSLFRIVVWVMLLYCVAVWLLIPTVRDLYKTVLEFGESEFTSADYNQNTEKVGSLARSMQTLFKLFFDIVRIVVPMYLIIWFKRRGFAPKIAIIAGVLFACLQLFFISSTTARAVICAFLIIYFISRLYPQYSKKIMNTAIISAVFVIVVYFAIRFTVGSRYGDNPIEYLSKIITAYFGGVDNVAVGNHIPEGHEASTLFASIYSSIPFNSTLFGLKVENLQSIYNTANGSYGQIPPMIVEGAYYFGELFAPIMSCICAAAAYHFGERYARTSSAWHLVSNLFLAIICSISIVMYNEEILLVWLLEWLVPMKILSKLADWERG